MLHRPRRSSLLPAASALCLSVALAAGCVPSADLPDDCDASSVTREATVADTALDPKTIEVCKGQDVTIEVTVEQAGELHFHGYDEEIPEKEVEPGDVVDLEFTAVRSGQFPIELHGAEDETEIGTLVVHEH